MTDASITREDLVRAFAEVSHATYKKQKREQLMEQLQALDMPSEPTAHDIERAENTVERLRSLGLLPEIVGASDRDGA